MATLTEASARQDIIKRLRRAEGQLRGVQRMVEEGAHCLDVAQQFSAVRKALDSTYARMTVCLLEQEVKALHAAGKGPAAYESLLKDVQKLLMRGS